MFAVELVLLYDFSSSCLLLCCTVYSVSKVLGRALLNIKHNLRSRKIHSFNQPFKLQFKALGLKTSLPDSKYVTISLITRNRKD
jgi:hypothetical protein